MPTSAKAVGPAFRHNLRVSFFSQQLKDENFCMSLYGVKSKVQSGTDNSFVDYRYPDVHMKPSARERPIWSLWGLWLLHARWKSVASIHFVRFWKPTQGVRGRLQYMDLSSARHPTWNCQLQSCLELKEPSHGMPQRKLQSTGHLPTLQPQVCQVRTFRNRASQLDFQKIHKRLSGFLRTSAKYGQKQ
jgi:hypothetical protein